MGKYLKISLMLIVLSLAACASSPSKDNALNDEGYRAMQDGDMEKAERLLTEAVEKDPYNWQATINLADLYRMTNRPGEARQLYQRVIDAENDADEEEEEAEYMEELARLANIAREKIAQMDQEQTAQQESVSQEPAPVTQPAIEAVPEEPVAPAPAPVPARNVSGYRVQVGAYAVSANADNMEAKLVKRHASLIGDMEVFKVEVNRMIKVQIGPYGSLAAAKSACRNLKSAGVDCFTVKP